MGDPEPDDCPILRLMARAALSILVLGAGAHWLIPIENEAAAAKAEYPKLLLIIGFKTSRGISVAFRLPGRGGK